MHPTTKVAPERVHLLAFGVQTADRAVILLLDYYPKTMITPCNHGVIIVSKLTFVYGGEGALSKSPISNLLSLTHIIPRNPPKD